MKNRMIKSVVFLGMSILSLAVNAKDSDIDFIGYIETTALTASQNVKGDIKNGAFLNQEEGFNLNLINLMLCRNDGCPLFVKGPQHNIISRVGPFPGPKKEEVDIGFNFNIGYGKDVTFLRTTGVDDFKSDLDNDEKAGILQAYVDVYTPLLGGTNFLVGHFFTSASGQEIGLAFNPPNWFATHSYSLQHSPAKHVGGLVTTKIPTSKEFGLLSLEAGLVAGWNNLENSRPTFLGGVRWRSPDFLTWVDFEMIYGDGENDAPGPGKGGSPYVAISSTGKTLNRLNANLTVSHQATPKLQYVLDSSYGFQKGGDVPGPGFFITEDSEWYGMNVGARYKLKDNLHVAGRAEWFKDEKAAHVLWGSTGATGGSVTSLTAGLEWQATPNIRIRPEIRYDKYSGKGLSIFGDGQEDDQVIGMVNTVINF